MKVLMMVMNTFENDSRVHRTARTLAEQGMDVTLLCLHKEGLPKEEHVSGYRVIRRKLSPKPSGVNPIKARVSELRKHNIILFTLVGGAYSTYKALSISLRLVYKIIRRTLGFIKRAVRHVLKDIQYFIRSIVFGTKRATSLVTTTVGNFLRKARLLVRRRAIATLDYLMPGLVEDLAFNMRKRKYDDFANEALNLAAELKPDIVHAHDFNCLIGANEIYKKLSVPYVYDSHELWVERNRSIAASAEEKNWELTQEESAIKEAAASITVCDSIADHLSDAYKVTRPNVVRNTPERKIVSWDPNKDIRKEFPINEDDFVCVYLGILAHNRGLTDILQALPGLDPKIKFIALGPMNPSFRDTFFSIVADLKLEDRAFYHEPVPGKEVSTWIKRCDVSLTTMNRSCLSYVYTLPNKLFESIQAELPIIGPDSPEIIRIVDQYKCGLTYRDGEPAHLAEQINKLFLNRDLLKELKAGSQRASADLCWENERNRLVETYNQALSRISGKKSEAA